MMSNRKAKLRRSRNGVPEDAMEHEITRRLIRFEQARIDASRYDISNGLPSLDMWFSYCNAQEGEFRAKFEGYNAMYNINAALMLTISLPLFFEAASFDIDEDSFIFTVVIYLLAIASGGFLFTLAKTSAWVTSGVTFIADDLDALAFTSRYYPAAIGSGYVIGVWLLGIAMIFFVCDVLKSQEEFHRYIIGVLLGIMMFLSFMNETYEWAYIFKKTFIPPTVFWDSSKDKFTAEIGCQGSEPKKGIINEDSKSQNGGVVSYDKKWNGASGAWENCPAGELPEQFIDVVNLTQWAKTKNPGIKKQMEFGYVTNIIDKVESMRVFYDIPADKHEPEPLNKEKGFNWIVSKVFTNGSGYKDNPEYIQWMFTWQLKPAWRAKLKHHLPPDTIQLRTKSAKSSLMSTDFDVFESKDATWKDILTDAGLGSAWSEIGSKFDGLDPKDLESLSFLNKLGALEAIGVTKASTRIKIANAF